ncbi:hypothetical protein [Streptomyces sp. S.PB5]|uniref:hypothetical protein n=1 Tax=Streptomyces sp. S.PB5 TaxID=3020844 RepID=UPI0025B265FC|nr:hypothetical protein [Streptomyces sp. S.PB5]MDN3027581.1 hypothetical protein [Streptomyces sp. S.PB5]
MANALLLGEALSPCIGDLIATESRVAHHGVLRRPAGHSFSRKIEMLVRAPWGA